MSAPRPIRVVSLSLDHTYTLMMYEELPKKLVGTLSNVCKRYFSLPFVELLIDGEGGVFPPDYLMLHCSLWTVENSDDPNNPAQVVREPAEQNGEPGAAGDTDPILCGTTTSTPAIGEHDGKGIWLFRFDRLALQYEPEYLVSDPKEFFFVFTLLHLDKGEIIDNGKASVVAVADSKPFQIVNHIDTGSANMVYRNDRSRRDETYDDETVYSDADSYDSRVDIPHNGPAPTLNQLMARPIFYLNKEDSHKPVYEAYSLRCDGLDDYYVERSSMGGEQSDLAQMHLTALELFQRKHRSGWASRVFGGKRRTYEQQVDEKCKKLPQAIQDEIYNLLEERGRHSSTIYRTRTWTVAVVRVLERYRFAKPELDEKRHHKLRFWKNSKLVKYHTYQVIIRGSETDVCLDPRGFSQFADFTNPWREADLEEGRHMGRERDRMWNEQRRKIAAERRKRSSSPPSYRDWRERSPSPERGPDRRRQRSPPSYQHRRSRSPMSEPETEVEARRYIRMTRAAARNAPPPVPMPPQQPAFERCARPPFARSPSPYADRSYSRPRVPYVEENTWVPDPQYDQDDYPRPTVSVYAPQHFGFPASEADDDNPDDGPHAWRTSGTPQCIACQVTPECAHYSRSRVCDRPINWHDNRATHPPCFICMAAGGGEFQPPPFAGPPPPPVPCCMLFSSTAPPPYPPTERPGSRASDRDIEREANDPTDIESDGEEDLDDGETTAVAESPRQAKEDE
ncbi:hypothetical protein B0T16DRAFT_490431 [Cercophora newfieldiana]|uniref:Uncharacterized protein n=1 Tax=Cercophora newfieldiana TaxID=92897 RepID=A0AA40CV40_9PEZI|nr:hypothetical protein B0T16DRAFT_490431 [Cercophora newfieldiana]